MFKNFHQQILPPAARFIFLALLWLPLAGCMPLVRLPPAPRQSLSASEVNAQTGKNSTGQCQAKKDAGVFSSTGKDHA